MPSLFACLTRVQQCLDLNNRDHALRKCEAAVGARLTLDLCQEIEAADSWEESIDDIVSGFEKQQRRKLMYSISFY
ncbi:RNA polymerase II subunit A C-terminal domain phosphatase SSU72-like [Pyrus ussuriensis x Pyrus communis]|uniref:RNA polymerase II subunit A C-terminal domain phosphatase SSU72 n=1 Tax=Pyrus ussuriensis x Pyrus communis TaxID=2448454 RepID=A0A5N5GUE1_9ROSA|nr:RNA polymerase II subunit A C-terminal domain phosphatase SSU72-like [Pyrus ussuriensis x Pyrus communis]